MCLTGIAGSVRASCSSPCSELHPVKKLGRARGQGRGCGGKPRGNPGAAVGKGAPVVSPRPGDESANGRPLGGGWPGGFRGWDPRSMIIYGKSATGLVGGRSSAGMLVIGGVVAVYRVTASRRADVSCAVHSMTSREAGEVGVIFSPLVQSPIATKIHHDHGTACRHSCGAAGSPAVRRVDRCASLCNLVL